MKPNYSSPSPSRANEVWRRFVGMFGGDSVERKYGKTPPPEWEAMLSRLRDPEIERGIRRLAYSGKAHVPALPEFVKLCRAIGTDEFDEGRPPLPQLAAPTAWEGDQWDRAANRYLLGHIATRLRDKPDAYGQPADWKLMRASPAEVSRLGLDWVRLNASGDFIERVNKLIEAKKRWAADMRDLAVNREDGLCLEVPVATQQELWREYIQRAEA